VNNETIDYPEIKETCQRLFAYRRLQKWPSIVSKSTAWDVLYDTQKEGLDVLESVDEAVDWVNHFISTIGAS
jgi:hypothetical protein